MSEKQRPETSVWIRPEDHKVQNRVDRALADFNKRNEQKKLPEPAANEVQAAQPKKKSKNVKLGDAQYRNRLKDVNRKFGKRLREAGIMGGRREINITTGKEIDPLSGKEIE